MEMGDLEREERLLEQARSTRFWMRLPPVLLARFKAERNAAELRGSGVAIVCAVVVLDSFIITDLGMVPDVLGLVIWVRLLVLTPLAVLYIPLSRWLVRRDPSTIWHHVYVAAVTTLTVAWVCSVQVSTRADQGFVFYVGGFLVVVFYAAALHGPLTVKAPAMVLMVLVFAGSMPWVTVMTVPHRLDASLGMVGFAAFAMLGAYRDEDSARQRFVLNCRTQLLECRRESLLSELATANESLSHQATRDALTGVPNRRAVDDAMGTWSDGEAVTGALVVLDLDHFKAYNDEFGHLGGDDVLRQVARAMSATLRGDEVMLARYGGEEFIALLRQVSPVGAQRAAERLRAAVEAQKILLPESVRDDKRPFVTVSVGGAWTASTALCTAEQLMSIADTALYQAKAAGRNKVRFSPLIEDETSLRTILAASKGDSVAM